MATTPNSIITPQTPYSVTASLSGVSACTSRGPTADGSMTSTPIFGVALVPTSTNGRRIDKISINGCSTTVGGATVAATVILWISNGTTAYPFDEITIPVVTPSATTPALVITKDYSGLVLPAAFKMYVSTTVATTAATNAMCVTAFGGDY